MSYSERAYAGPDISGRTYPAEPCQHVAALLENQRQERHVAAIINARRLTRAARHETPLEQAERYGRETLGEVA